jgi:hypothetical protein
LTKACRWVLLIAVSIHGPLFAGEIPGLPSSLPPYIDTDFELSFSNDFLGRGGSVDDFRTQQFIVTANIGDKWVAGLDHSVLTLTDPLLAGRLDQLSGSLGYRFINQSEDRFVNRVTAGLGFRGVGDFAGERMQNGFHRLIESAVEVLPYSDVDETYLTAWIDAERYSLMHQTDSGWRFGYWLRASSLLTSDGQWDGSVAVMGVAGKAGLDLWAGLRQDWRTGYDEIVQRATAAAEEDLAVVVGMRFGTLVLETVQQLNNDASYGQLRLVSSESQAPRGTRSESGLGLELGFLLPDVHLHLAARFGSNLLTSENSIWKESVILTADLGEPQYEDNVSVFVDTTQIGIGLEWERLVSARSDWLSAYGSVAAGWRSESLIGDGPLLGEKSGSVDRGVLILSAGLRFHASALSDRWRYRIQTGISAWLPTSDATLTLAVDEYTVQQPAIGFSVGVTFDFD